MVKTSTVLKKTLKTAYLSNKGLKAILAYALCGLIHLVPMALILLLSWDQLSYYIMSFGYLPYMSAQTIQMLILQIYSFLLIPMLLLSVYFIFVGSVLNLGVTKILYHAYRNEEVKIGMMFSGFKTYGRSLGGMLKQSILLWLWGLIPLAGPVMMIIKSLAYSFNPVIILTRPDVPSSDCLKASVQITEGYKGKMFGGGILLGLIITGFILVPLLITFIPVLALSILAGIVMLVVMILSMLAVQLLPIAYYCEIMANGGSSAQYTPAPVPYYGVNPPPTSYNGQGYVSFQSPPPGNANYQPPSSTPAPEQVPAQNPAPAPEAPEAPAQQKASFCPDCGAKLAPGSSFCSDCGRKV